MRPALKSFLIFFAIVMVCAGLWTSPALAQTPSQNINIVSGPVQVNKDPVTGTVTILGDPFLQRQNEPSLAVSTANPLHLMAGANDYRSVDIPFADQLPSRLVGDAWCGWFFSADGGQSWQSTLLPGYPQDNTALGQQSPLKAFNVCSDPTVRPGPAGMFFYSGISFNRATGASVVYVSRFLDRNNSEKGNLAQNTAPIRYLDTVIVDTGTTGQFLDKTWNAVLLQKGSGTCSITVPKSATQTETVTVPSMSVYVVWSRFTGSTSSKIMVTKSDTCGNPGTYATPVKVSEGNSVNQGTVLAVSQAIGDIYMAWRRFKTSSQSDAMMAATCSSSLKQCGKAVEITANLPSPFNPYTPFDQPSTKTTFRTNSMPAIAVSVDKSQTARVHVAFAARDANGDAKILLATSNDGSRWPVSQIQQVDPGPIVDDNGVPYSRGDQLMPAMAFTEGKLVVTYYFSNFDHTVGRYDPSASFPEPDPDTGKFFKEYRDKRGELLSNPALVYSSLDDGTMTQRRHTIDVRMAQADVDDPLNNPFAPLYHFTFAEVSHYVFGASDSPTLPTNELEDLQANPPNLSMFGNGTLAFIGDYIDVAGLMFVQNGNGWIPNDASTKTAAQYVVWADNRDVRPPKNGDYSNYTPVGSNGEPSLFDPTQNRPACAPGQEGMKDQNVYVSRITQGFLLTVPQNMKPLGFRSDAPGTLLERAFTVLVQNFTKDPRSFRLTIVNQPPDAPPSGNGRASFDQSSLVTTLDVSVSANSGVARSIFVRSSTVAASILINGAEITAPGGSLVTGGFASFVTLNPPGSVTALAQPDGIPGDISSLEVYNPLVRSPLVRSPLVRSPLVRSPLVRSPLVRSPLVRSTSIADLDPSLAWNTSLEDSSTAATFDPTAANTSGGDTSSPISEATYVLTNMGNTAATYTLKLIGNAPPGTTFQLIISQPSNAVTAQNCQLVVQEQNVVVTNISTPPYGADPNNLGDPNISAPQTVTVSVPPGDSRLITLRGDASLEIAEQATELSAPVAVSQGVNTGETTNTIGVPLFITTTSLPVGVVAAPYSGSGFALQTVGGTLPFSWSVQSVQGNLSDLGLSFDGSTGTIFGTPTHAGTVTVKFQVTDAATPDQGLAKKTLTLTVDPADTITAITSDNPDPSGLGEPVEVYFTVNGAPPSSGAAIGSVTVSVNDGVTSPCTADVSTGHCTLVIMTPGTKTLRADFLSNADYNSSYDTASHGVKADTLTSITVLNPEPSVVGQSVAVSFAVVPKPPATGTPTGTVTVTSDDGPTCSASVATGSCTLTFTTTGIKTLTASYPGDGVYSPSTTSVGTAHTVNRAATTTKITADTPDPSITGQSYTVSFAVSVNSPGAGLPTGSVTVSDGAGATCTATLAAGSCSLTSTTVGTRTLTATYAGDSNFNGSSGTASHQVFYVFTGFDSPMATAGTLTSPSLSPAQKYGSAIPLKFELANFTGVLISDLSAVSSIVAIANSKCSGPPTGATTLLYSPTSGATGGSTFRFSSGFIINWDTSSVPSKGCYAVVVQPNDGSPAKATYVQLR